MGIHTAPTLVNRTVSIGSTYDQGDVFVKEIKSGAKQAGWTREKILGHIMFTAFAIADNNTITLAGTTFVFVGVLPPGAGIQVPRGSSNADAINNLGPI